MSNYTSEFGADFLEPVSIANGWKILWQRTFWNECNDDHTTWVVVESDIDPGFHAFGVWQDMWCAYGFPANQCSTDPDELVELVEMWEREGLNDIDGWPDMCNFRNEIVPVLQGLNGERA